MSMANGVQAAAEPAPLPRLLVLYGSETGNAQDVAEYVQQLAWARNLRDTQAMAMDTLPLGNVLPSCSMVVFVVSTTGDGEPPQNMRTAWRSLLRKNLSSQWLEGVQVAVFGLGDSSYAKYNAVARRLQARLVQLGAKDLVDRGLGDDQHALGYYGALNPWLVKLWEVVLAQHPLPEGFVINDKPVAIEPLYQVLFHTNDSSEAEQARAMNAQVDNSEFYAPPRNAVHEEIYMAKLQANKRITAAEWTQDVRHLEFELVKDASPSSPLFKAGAIAEVHPENTTGVDDLLGYVGVDGSKTVTILSADGSPQSDLPSPCTVCDLFTKYLDILGTPRRSFFDKLSLFAADAEEKEKLEELASPDGADLLYDYCIREKKTYVEALGDFPSAKPPLVILLQLIPRLRPRSYSISSSSLLHPGKVHLTVAIVDFLTPYKRRRQGICSSFFQSLDPQKDLNRVVPMWIKTGLFDPPSRDQDMLLIGPGTGLAAMRAIVQERKVLRATSASLGHTYLYFGSRHKHKDFLYGEELTALAQSGDLTALHTAFSRDQDHKIYVQTRLAEQKEQVFEFLMNGGYCYVAGSAKRMPTDVYEVLRDILRSVGQMSLRDAESVMKAMVRTKRYVVESWS